MNKTVNSFPQFESYVPLIAIAAIVACLGSFVNGLLYLKFP